jgi:hypothetical protein
MNTWDFALVVLDWIAPLLRYRAAWEYAAHKPVQGRHARWDGKPKHAAPTTFLAQLGWAQRTWGMIIDLEDRLDQAPKTA